MTGFEFLRSTGTTVEQIADIIAEHCPPVTPEHCDKLSCRECWLAWLAVAQAFCSPKEKGHLRSRYPLSGNNGMLPLVASE